MLTGPQNQQGLDWKLLKPFFPILRLMSFPDRFNRLAQDGKTTLKDAAGAVSVPWPWPASVPEKPKP